MATRRPSGRVRRRFVEKPALRLQGGLFPAVFGGPRKADSARLASFLRESDGPLTRAGMDPTRPCRGLCIDGPSDASGGQDEIGPRAAGRFPGACRLWIGSGGGNRTLGGELMRLA